jgi:hypothetical protein
VRLCLLAESHVAFARPTVAAVDVLNKTGCTAFSGRCKLVEVQLEVSLRVSGFVSQVDTTLVYT